jgi:hypothetical protein
VNKADTTVGVTSVTPAPIFVGQQITVSYAVLVSLPGFNSPMPPTGGTITVMATDGGTSPHASTCVVPIGGTCTLAPAPTVPGNYSLTIVYSGDGNFNASPIATSGYTVYQLVFTAQPSNTGAGLTITPAIQVTAEDSSNNPLTTFTDGVTLAIGSGSGTLTGTTTQNAVAGVASFNDLGIDKVGDGYTLTSKPAGGVTSSTSKAFNIDTFYVDQSGNFGTLDLASGTATQIGSLTATNSTGLDLAPGLQLYEYNTSNQLMHITPSTGVTTPVGSPGTLPNPAKTRTGALTTGAYYAIDNVDGTLYSIDLSTGATTPVGTIPTTTTLVTPGCTFEASLAGSANMLYYTIGIPPGQGTGCTASPDSLYAIDPKNGTTTTVGQVTVNGLGVNAFVGSAFVNGTLYGFTANGKEYTIDPATGMATFVANTAANILGAGGF